jgi:hypothetical protein
VTWFLKWDINLNRHFSKEDIQQAYEKMFNTTNHQGKSIQTTRYHLTPLPSKQNKRQESESIWKKESLVHFWRECKLVQPLWKIVLKFLKKLTIKLPYDPTILLLGT